MTDGKIVDISVVKEKIEQRFEVLSNKGFRSLGVCFRDRDFITILLMMILTFCIVRSPNLMRLT
jgi:hypothetical protein